MSISTETSSTGRLRRQRTTGLLFEHASSIGLEQMQADVSGGQFKHPTGLFYGGSKPTWSNQALLNLLVGSVSGVERLTVIDLHTGLGEWGVGEVMTSYRPDDAGAEVTACALEFGTADTVTVLQALRADAWLHAHGDPTAENAAATRAQVRAAFADDNPAWLEAVTARCSEVFTQALT